MVWIHGGYNAGAGGEALCAPSAIVRGMGVIVVTPGYSLMDDAGIGPDFRSGHPCRSGVRWSRKADTDRPDRLAVARERRSRLNAGPAGRRAIIPARSREAQENVG